MDEKIDTVTKSNNAIEAARDSSSRALSRVVLVGGAVVAVVAGVLFVAGNLVMPEQVQQPQIVQNDLCSAEALAQSPAGCVERENYLTKLRQLQTELGPQLEEIAFKSWDSDVYQRIKTFEETALAAFEAADYAAADTSAGEAVALAQQGLARAPVVLQEALTQMVSGFEQGDVQLAQESLALAKSIDENAQPVRSYEPRIRVLSEALRLLEQAKVARVENKLALELAALQELVALDPARQEHNARISEIQRVQREATYSKAVARAEQAIQRLDARAAREHMARAARVVPGRDLSFLLTRIEQIERNQRLAFALTRATKAASSDDFKGAQVAFAEALAIDASHKQALEGHTEAGAIVAAKARLAGYLAQPLRLASPRVAKFALADVASYQGLLQRSSSLRELEASVQAYLVKAQRPVTVAVFSDGATDVSVRRVGIVGKHKTKTIELTPGLYEFEGRRPGYKSALVELEIPYGVDEIEVRVIANERI